MKRNTQNFACVAFALLSELVSPGLLSSQEKAQLRQYDVVPPVWITSDGDLDRKGEIEGAGQERAFVFPSLAPADIAPGTGTHPIKLNNFLRSNNRLKSRTFEWAAERSIKLILSRVGTDLDVTIEIDSDSMSRIRQLDWGRFRQLQGAFKDWLLKRSGCTIFTDGESRFAEFHRHLIAMWKEVLRRATFERFSAEYLNLPGPILINYVSSSPSPSTSPIDKEKTRMFGIEIEPREMLSVTWGGENVYPAATLMTSYSRSTSTGSSRVQIVSALGMRLYPAANCGTASVGQQENEVNDQKVLIPYPNAWKGIIGREFMPIYNLFDLHNPALLQKKGVAPPADCMAHEERTPKHLFLLSPAHYVKADEGPDGPVAIAQFENEARPGIDPGARDQINLLARQFVIMGCDSVRDVSQEWSRFLEVAYAALTGNRGPVTKTSCSGYLHGVFSGKSFVEIRNHFSVNGHPIEEGALPSETIGNAVGAALGAHLNLEGLPGSGPVIELRRTPPARKNNLLAHVVQIRFHTTMSAVLDQVSIREGDEIYGGSISEVLR